MHAHRYAQLHNGRSAQHIAGPRPPGIGKRGSVGIGRCGPFRVTGYRVSCALNDLVRAGVSYWRMFRYLRGGVAAK